MKKKAPENGRRVMLKDVAAAAGVHVGTASRALSGTGEVAEATRERVRAAAERLGYTPDPMLRALSSYRKTLHEESYHGTIAWLLTDQHHDPELFASLCQNMGHALESAQRLGYRLEEFRLADLPKGRLERMLAARGVQGLLLPPQTQPGKCLDMDIGGFSAVTIGHTLEFPSLNRVLPHQFENTRLLLRELRARGFRRIGFWLPKVIDNRSHGAFSAGFWREQQEWPARCRVPIALPDDFDPPAFLDWFRQHKPDHLIGIPLAFQQWLDDAGLPRIPVSFPGELGDSTDHGVRVHENWPLIYAAALRMLDGMVRHRETGIPEHPRIMQIPGELAPHSAGTPGQSPDQRRRG